MQLSIKDFSDITGIPLSSAHGFSKSHNQNTLTSIVLRSFSKEDLISLYEKVIDEEGLVIVTKDELYEKLLGSFFKSDADNIEKNYFPFRDAGWYDVYAENTNTKKRFAILFKLTLENSDRNAKKLEELEKEGTKEFGDFEIIIFTLKSNSDSSKDNYKNLNLQYIGDLLNITDDSKLIVLPKPGKGGSTE